MVTFAGRSSLKPRPWGSWGAVSGSSLGLFGARAALGSVRATVTAAVQDGYAPSPIQLEPSLAVVGVLLGLAVSLVAALVPLAEAERTPPIQGLRGERPERLSPGARRRAALVGLLFVLAAWGLARLPPVGDLPLAALGAALALLAALLATSGLAVDTLVRVDAAPLGTRLGLPLRLAGAALGAGRRRAAWAAGAVGVTLALAVALATMVHSFRATVVEWTEQGMRSDLWVRPRRRAAASRWGGSTPRWCGSRRGCSAPTRWTRSTPPRAASRVVTRLRWQAARWRWWPAGVACRSVTAATPARCFGRPRPPGGWWSTSPSPSASAAARGTRSGSRRRAARCAVG